MLKPNPLQQLQLSPAVQPLPATTSCALPGPYCRAPAPRNQRLFWGKQSWTEIHLIQSYQASTSQSLPSFLPSPLLSSLFLAEPLNSLFNSPTVL